MSDAHAQPEGECVFCCEDLDATNYVEYQAKKDGAWHPAPYCQACIEMHFINALWQKYLDDIAKADCAAALRRVLTRPPPTNVRDAGFVACKENGNNEEVYQFWYASTQAVASAKLQGSFEGKERDAFWQEKKNFMTATEAEEEVAKAATTNVETDAGAKKQKLERKTYEL